MEIEFEKNFCFKPKFPNDKRRIILLCTVEMVNNVFQTNDEVVGSAHGLPTTTPRMRDQSPVMVKVERDVG